MPKYNKEMEEKIITLIEQGYKNAEISRELDIYRGAVAKRRKAYEKRRQNQEKPEPEQTVQQEQTDSHPLDPQIYTLIRYQGTNSREEALSQAIETQHSFNPYLLNHGLKTPKELIKFFEDKSQLDLANVEDMKRDYAIHRRMFVENTETIIKLEELVKKRYEEGYQKGTDDHALLVPCTSCGEPITILPGTEAHRHIVDFLREHGIIHTDCKPRYQRIYVK